VVYMFQKMIFLCKEKGNLKSMCLLEIKASYNYVIWGMTGLEKVILDNKIDQKTI
jgi:hypothetical protein